MHNDSELGPAPVLSSDPVWPWYLVGAFFVLVPALMAGAAYFGWLSHRANPSHPVVVEPK